MKRIILLALICSGIAGAQQLGQVYGFPFSGNGTSSATQVQDATAKWISQGWMPLVSKTVSKVKVPASAVTGSPSTTDLQLSICPGSPGPGTCASPITTSTTTAATPAAGWIEFIDFSGTPDVTAFTQYYIVLSSPQAGSGKYATWRYLTFASPYVGSGGYTGSQVALTTNGGSTWSNSTAGTVLPFRVEFTDAFVGLPVLSVTGASQTTNERAYSTNEWGVYFTVPSNVSMNVKAVAMSIIQAGTPTGNARIRVYSDNGSTATLLATSDVTVPSAGIPVTGTWWVTFGFTNPVTFAAGTSYRVVLSETTQADANSKYFSATYAIVDSDSNSLALLPFGGTLRGGYCASSCTTSSNWTVDYNIPLFALMLDPAGEFNATGAGGGAHAWVQ